MKAKEKLSEIYKLNVAIETLECELLELDTIAKGCAISYDEKIQSSPGNSTENIICRILELKEKINDKIKEKLKLMEKLTFEILELDNTELSTLLLKRYVNCHKWEQIAIDMNYSVRQIYRLHGRALQEFEKNKSWQ